MPELTYLSRQQSFSASAPSQPQPTFLPFTTERMCDSDPMASSASLLTTNTTSSSFDPTKSGKSKQSRGQKDYAAALSMLQSKYGLHDSSALSMPPPSKKSPTSKSSSQLHTSLATTSFSSTNKAPSSTSRGRQERSKRIFPSLFASESGKRPST